MRIYYLFLSSFFVTSFFSVVVYAAADDWEFLRPVTSKSRSVRVLDFQKMLELSSENPVHFQNSQIKMKSRSVPRFRRSRIRERIEVKESLDLSLIEREGMIDLDREKLRQDRARRKSLRFQRSLSR